MSVRRLAPTGIRAAPLAPPLLLEWTFVDCKRLGVSRPMTSPSLESNREAALLVPLTNRSEQLFDSQIYCLA
jgi:hypothetical protein